MSEATVRVRQGRGTAESEVHLGLIRIKFMRNNYVHTIIDYSEIIHCSVIIENRVSETGVCPLQGRSRLSWAQPKKAISNGRN
jgi:hypothetical protein